MNSVVLQALARMGWKASGMLVLLAVMMPPLIVVLTMRTGWEATFTVNAETEVLTVTTSGSTVPAWYLNAERLRIDQQDFEGFTGQLQLGTDTQLRLVRLGNESLRLEINALSTELPAAVFYDQDEQVLALVRDRAQLIVNLPPEAALVLPVSGQVVVGDTVFAQVSETSPVLLRGEARVLGLSVLNRDRFAAGTATLDPGDSFSVEFDSQSSGGHGLIRLAQNQPGMQVTFHANGRRAHIIRYGSGGYELAPSVWARVSSDPLYQAMLALYAAILPIAGLGIVTLGMSLQRQLDEKRRRLAAMESGIEGENHDAT